MYSFYTNTMTNTYDYQFVQINVLPESCVQSFDLEMIHKVVHVSWLEQQQLYC